MENIKGKVTFKIYFKEKSESAVYRMDVKALKIVPIENWK